MTDRQTDRAEELARTLREIRPADREAAARCRARWNRLGKPLYGLGELEELVVRLAGIRGTERVEIGRRALAVFCADNGVVARGVSQTGQEVTAAVAGNIQKGMACSAIMGRRAGLEVFVTDVGMAADVPGVERRKLRYGTADITRGPAMSREEMLCALCAGIGKAREFDALGMQLAAAGEMGIGNTTTSSALTAVLLDLPPAEVTGRGAGLSEEGLRTKIRCVEEAIRVNRPDPSDPLDVLQKLGGFDIAALTGFYLGAAACRLPAVLDGAICAVAALLAIRLAPAARDYLIPSHISEEPSARALMKALGFRPVIRAGMHLGEGTGAAALLPLLDMALDVYNDMGTFEEIRVRAYTDYRAGEDGDSPVCEMLPEEPACSFAILSFTEAGGALGNKLHALLEEEGVSCRSYAYAAGPGAEAFADTRELMGRLFDEADAILVIGAAGIAVRAAAPFLKGKTSDPAVLVMDEQARHVVSLLSGHLGGANDWCRKIAGLIGADPVITTATDLREAFAVDLFARDNGLWIRDPKKIREISAGILRGETVGICSDLTLPKKLPKGLEALGSPEKVRALGERPRLGITVVTGLPGAFEDTSREEPLFPVECRLEAKNLYLGIGCRKGKPREELEAAVTELFGRYGLDRRRFQGIASIELKREEAGILALARDWELPYTCYSAEELNRAEGEFHTSAFVREQTGTDSVAERSAVTAAGPGAVLLIGKQARDGVTLAVAAAPTELNLGIKN